MRVKYIWYKLFLKIIGEKFAYMGKLFYLCSRFQTK